MSFFKRRLESAMRDPEFREAYAAADAEVRAAGLVVDLQLCATGTVELWATDGIVIDPHNSSALFTLTLAPAANVVPA